MTTYILLVYRVLDVAHDWRHVYSRVALHSLARYIHQAELNGWNGWRGLYNRVILTTTSSMLLPRLIASATQTRYRV
jgi:hypothetical protein